MNVDILASQVGIDLRTLGSSLPLLLTFLDDEHIWDRLPINDILSLNATSSFVAALGSAYLHKRLLAFFRGISSDVFRFREEMRRNGAVISGSVLARGEAPGISLGTSPPTCGRKRPKFGLTSQPFADGGGPYRDPSLRPMYGRNRLGVHEVSAQSTDGSRFLICSAATS